MSRFRIGPGGREPAEPWFRVGRLEVSTTVAVVVLVVLAWIVWAIQPGLSLALYFSPAAVLRGEAWRVLSWPFAEGPSLWSVLTLVFFWYFGRDVEQLTGRVRMAWLLLGIVVAQASSALLASLAFGTPVALVGLGPVELVILLLWIAEYPHRRFFFNIPAWVVGLVLLALQVLSLMGARGWPDLAALLLGLSLSALVARNTGLLGDYRWLPRFGRRAPRAPRVRGRWSQRRRADQRAADRARLDDLLDRINLVGINGLSEAEKRELRRLRDRLRANR